MPTIRPSSERLVGKFELYSMLEKGLDDIEHGRVKPVREVFARIEEDMATLE